MNNNDKCIIIKDGTRLEFNSFIVIGINSLSSHEAQLFSYVKGDYNYLDKMAIIDVLLMLSRRLLKKAVNLDEKTISSENYQDNL